MSWRKIATDGLPTEDATYLVFAPSADPKSPFKAMGWYDPSCGWSLLPSVWIDAITHWMPLPESPADYVPEDSE